MLGLAVFGAAPVGAFAVGEETRATDYKIHYDLSRDQEGRSRLTTTETITMDYVEPGRHHGIERAIPKSYDGHSVSLGIDSVTNASGTGLNFTTYTQNDNLVVRIGDKDKFVYGLQTYKITYSQRDVTRTFNDTGSDEFYWETVGGEWSRPIDRLEVSLTIDSKIAAKLNGKATCYIGVASSSNECDITRTDTTFSAAGTDLSRYESITIAVGFSKQTFSAYKMSLWDQVVAIYMGVMIVTAVIGLLVILLMIIRYQGWSKRSSEVGTIIPEYLPPTETSLTAAASLIAPMGSIFTAQLLDFAVRDYIKIYQTSEKSFFKMPEYDIEIIKDISGLPSEEQEILKDIFSDDVAVGKRLKLGSLRNNTKVYNRTVDNTQKLNDLVRGSYGLRSRNQKQTAWFKKLGWSLLGISVLLLSPGLFVASMVAFITASMLWPLTDKGLGVYRYLEGLKLYIKVAEQDRLRMLQSPEGAEKVGGVDPNDPAQLIKLYEKVLPYAVLFGQEKEWSKRIGDLYQTSQTTPNWYSGMGAFNAASFSTSMGGFSTTATYSSASSSSSGGSTGGGSVGGGGGGGGGGTW